MGDATLWVAVLTAVTAIAASWVTSRGNAQAARVQALAAAEAQQAATRRDAMRTAHLAFSEQINHMGALYRKTPAFLGIGDPSERSPALDRHLEELRTAYGEFHQQLNVITLDGGHSSRLAADAVHAASTHVYKTLLGIAAGTQGPEDFASAVRAYWDTATAFLHAARQADE
ncbi:MULTISPECIES: hypothetical protein [Streptomyces]|nr:MULTISPECIES: hypothetical protein [Streptomyces violaceusniger group]